MKAAMAVRKKHPFLQVLKRMLRIFYRRMAILGADRVMTDSPAVFICNHLDSYAPIVMSLFFPFPYRPWVHAHIMLKAFCRDYLERDFTRRILHLPPPFSRWLAALIAPLCIRLMAAIEAIPVNRGSMRIMDTFKISIEALRQGSNLVIFPEIQDKRFSEHLNDFHTGFVHLARQYQRETGQILHFYPVFINRQKKTITVGKPAVYPSDTGRHRDRLLFAAYLRDSINDIAVKTSS